MLTLGFAVMIAGLLYFVLTIRTVAPKYRMSSVLSGVVMVSAFLILFFQQQSWENAFAWDNEAQLFAPDAAAIPFSNGYRYLNWLIDVPMLLFQILFVVHIAKDKRTSIRNWFWFSGAMMIVTGYFGQFYETNLITGGGTEPFFFWGFVSTLFFFHVLYLMYRVIQEGKKDMPADAARGVNMIWYLFLFSWFLYPGAYLTPLISGELTGADTEAVSAASVVARQLIFTVADVTSKLIYGVLLTNVAQTLSAHEGYVYGEDATGDDSVVEAAD